jgi:hypothetical protein
MTPEQRQARIDRIERECNFVMDSVGQCGVARFQDDQSGLFAQQLVRATFAELFRFSYPATKWMNGGLIPLDTSISDGATSYAYTELEQTGEAKIIGSNATDLPMADIAGKNNIEGIESVGIAIQYTRQQVRTARLNGTFEIAAEKVASAREAHDRTLNGFIRNGVPAVGFKGVIDQPGILVDAAITGNWIAGGASADEIIADVTAAINGVMNNSDQIEVPNTVLFPVAEWNLISTLRIGTGLDGSGATVLSFLRTAFPMIQRWDWEPGLSTGSATGGPCLLVYANDRSRMRAVFPLMMNATPVQERGLSFIINFETRFGGVMTPRPRSVLRLDGIGAT